MNIVFVIRALTSGGAERQVTVLARALSERGHRVTIVTFYNSRSHLYLGLEESGVRLISLGKRGRWDNASFVVNLIRTIKACRPDVVHGYLVTGNIAASLVSRFLPGVVCVWGLRASTMNYASYDWLSGLTFEITRWISNSAHLMISNSEAGRVFHGTVGYPLEGIEVIANGIDGHYFIRDEAAGLKARSNWGVAPSAVLIGCVGRLDHMKDQETFLRAAALTIVDRPGTRFVVVGSGSENYRQRLMDLSKVLGLDRAVIWAGECTDLVAVYSALSIATLTSQWGEGFPNVIAEAMACGTPVVASDVGDAALICGSNGIIVPPKDPERLKEGWVRLLSRPKGFSSEELRARILKEFSVDKLAARTEAALAKALRKTV